MSPKKMRDHLVDYYTGESLPENTTAWLGSLAKADVMGAASARRSAPEHRGVRVLYGLAGLVAILLFGNIALLYFDRQAEQEQPRAEPSPSRSWRQASMQPRFNEPVPTPNLLAVKVHADWCMRCPEVGRIFNKLAKKYGEQPVLFVTLDVTRDTTRRQAHLMASTLGIDWVTDRSFETGMVKLIDRQQRAVLATLTNEEQMAQWEGALTQALPQTLRRDTGSDRKP